MQRKYGETNQELGSEQQDLTFKQKAKAIGVLLVLGALLLCAALYPVYQARAKAEKARVAWVAKQRIEDARQAKVQAAKAAKLKAKFKAKHKGKKMAYNASGAGTAAANILYADNGTFNGKGAFLASNGFDLIWDTANAQWEIRDNTSDILYANTSDTADPPETGWDLWSGTSPAPTVTLDSGGGGTDPDGPFLDSASIDGHRKTLTIVLNDITDVLPTSAMTGFSLGGVTGRTVGNGTFVSQSGSSHTFTFPLTGPYLKPGDAPTLSYDAGIGNVTDGVLGGSGNFMASFSGQPITFDRNLRKRQRVVG